MRTGVQSINDNSFDRLTFAHYLHCCGLLCKRETPGKAKFSFDRNHGTETYVGAPAEGSRFGTRIVRRVFLAAEKYLFYSGTLSSDMDVAERKTLSLPESLY